MHINYIYNIHLILSDSLNTGHISSFIAVQIVLCFTLYSVHRPLKALSNEECTRSQLS